MNSAEFVDQRIQELKAGGIPLTDAAWELCKLCVGWPYIFGDTGQLCTPSQRQAVWARHADDQPTLKSACKNFDGTGSCSGCKWSPDGKRVRSYDCRGFTYWILLQIWGWKLQGAGCTSQWNNDANWKLKGEVSDGIPQDVVVCLFYYKKDSKGNRTSTLAHTGLYYNGETYECSSGVQYSKALNKKWEVWAVPACMENGVQPVPPQPEKGTAIVTGKNLALRQGPGTDRNIILRIPTGKTVKLKDLPEGWSYVEYNGKTGFVMDKFIRKEE